jgi:AraC-like DNA-binding protein
MPRLDGQVVLALAFTKCHLSISGLRLDDVARHVGLSPHYLSAQLKRATSLTFRAHLRSMRVAAAAELLESTSLSIKEIAFSVGYGATASLDREFRRARGCSPSHWREQRDNGSAALQVSRHHC